MHTHTRASCFINHSHSYLLHCPGALRGRRAARAGVLLERAPHRPGARPHARHVPTYIYHIYIFYIYIYYIYIIYYMYIYVYIMHPQTCTYVHTASNPCLAPPPPHTHRIHPRPRRGDGLHRHRGHRQAPPPQGQPPRHGRQRAAGVRLRRGGERQQQRRRSTSSGVGGCPAPEGPAGAARGAGVLGAGGDAPGER